MNYKTTGAMLAALLFFAVVSQDTVAASSQDVSPCVKSSSSNACKCYQIMPTCINTCENGNYSLYDTCNTKCLEKHQVICAGRTGE